MKKYILQLSLFSLLSCTSNTGSSQTIYYAQGDQKRVYEDEKKEVIDTCTLNIQYRMSSVEDTKNPKKKKENFMLLQIGKHVSKFSDFLRLKADSLSTIYALQKMDEIEAFNKLIPIQKECETFNIFKDYPNNNITVTDYMPLGGMYKYKEDKIKPNWIIDKDTITIGGFLCKKATTTYRGRNYTAWYTEQIPKSDGPWKFWGLPGLILKIVDDKNEYEFSFVAIEKPKGIEEIYIKNIDYFNSTRTKFNKGVKKFCQNPGPLFESMDVKVDGKSLMNITTIPYNPIELSE